MKTVRTALMAGFIAAALASLPTVSTAQIPVTDVVSIAARAEQMAMQLVQLKNQLGQMEQQYAALTGSSGAGSLLPNAIGQAANSFPQDWQNVYGDTLGGSSPYANSAGAMLSRMKQNIAGMTPSQAIDYAGQQREQEGAYNRAMTQKVYDDQMRNLSNLQDLTQQINSASSLKDTADLQARIGTAQGTIQAEQEKLQAMAMLQRAQSQLLETQENEANNRYMYGDALLGGQWNAIDITSGQ